MTMEPSPTTRLRVDVLTTFPEMFGAHGPCALNVSIPSRARAAGLVEWHAHNIRAFTHDRHQKTDDRPFGGGPGMVMMCQPLWDAVTAVEAMDPRPARRVLMTPQGKPLTQSLVEELARCPRVLVIAGHYEGIDERVIEALEPLEVSIGDYVLSGGELGAMVLMDAMIRLIPGAVGDEQSVVQDSFSSIALPISKRRGDSSRRGPASPSLSHQSPDMVELDRIRTDRAVLPTAARLLDCPHYTKPREWMGRAVPEVLLSGDHGAIEKWRLEQRIRRTLARRPELAPAGIDVLLFEQPPQGGEDRDGCKK